jgi:alpha-glucosidase
MEWRTDRWKVPFLDLYRRLNSWKSSEKALQDGAFQFLFADETTIAFARFDNRRALIGVLTKAITSRELRIPLRQLGIEESAGAHDLFDGTEHRLEDGEVVLAVPSQGNTIIACQLEPLRIALREEDEQN